MSTARLVTPRMTTLEMRTRLHASIGGRYHIERMLSEERVTTAYLARDVERGGAVLIRVLKSSVAATVDPDGFVREMRAAVGLFHPHVLPLLDAGDANGMLYYVVPTTDAHTLRDVIDSYGQLDAAEAVRITREVAGALDYAHERGVLHGDVRPTNILLQDGHTIVANFGLAIAIATADGNPTGGATTETVAYMSPEQAAGDPLDGRTDVYSLACTLYEMLVGEPPFTGPTVQAVVAQRVVRTPESVAAVRDVIPPTVARALQHALARSPADRPESPGAFAASLGA